MNFSSDLDLVSNFSAVSARLNAKFQFRKDFLTVPWVFLVVVCRSGVASQSVQNGFSELDMCFSSAELDLRPGEARLVVQSATPDLDLRDEAIFGHLGFLFTHFLRSIGSSSNFCRFHFPICVIFLWDFRGNSYCSSSYYVFELRIYKLRFYKTINFLINGSQKTTNV